MTRLILAPLAALVAAGALAAPAAAQSFPEPLPGPLGNPIVQPIELKPIQQPPEIRLTDCRKYWVYDKQDGSYSLQEVCFGFEVIKP
jgi:hypothetical protein